MKTLEVTLNHHNHPIYIGEKIAFKPEILKNHIKAKQVMIVSNETVAAHYLEPLKNALVNVPQCDEIILADGEQHKHIDTVMEIVDSLLDKQHTRATTLIALGGGVIGDMTGFAASLYQRGVDFIQIPTSLLAQVDASVGGKTGVNHSRGKNMIGAFHQPNAVIIDIAFLNTLPERHFAAGLAEIIKHGLIQDEAFFTELEQEISALENLDHDSLIDVLHKSCEIKARIVEQDEKEQSGTRALLNLGHTFAHAIETALNYEGILHGEAVAIGCVLAAKLSKLSEDDIQRITELFKKAKLPTEVPPHLSAEQLVDLMKHDKKNRNKDELRFVLLEKIGQAVLCEHVPMEDVLCHLD